MANGKNDATDALKQSRKDAGKTQLQLSLEMGYSREAISQQENGRASVSPDVSRHMSTQYNDPRVGIESAHEYKSWGLGWLDGEALDQHRAAVVMRTKKELKEALESIDEVAIAKQPKHIQEFERQQIEDALVESAEAIAFLEFEIAKLCQDYNFKYNDIFSSAEQRLRAERLVK